MPALRPHPTILSALPRGPRLLHPTTVHRRALLSASQQQVRAWSSTPRPLQQSLGNPLNLPKWLEENSHLLQPPINNHCVVNDAFTVMIVGGPNARTDYHINETAEWFFQYRGDMLLKVVEGEPAPTSTSTSTPRFRDIPIREGEMFYLPPNTPHNPVRFANTVGIVLEQRRPAGSLDRLRWYCRGCGGVVHEKAFHCTDLGTQIKEAVQAFEKDREARTCRACGEVCEVKPSR